MCNFLLIPLRKGAALSSYWISAPYNSRYLDIGHDSEPFWITTTKTASQACWSNKRIARVSGLISDKAMAPHSCILAWKIPWTEKPAVHGVVKSQTWLNDFTFTFHFHALEKEMATHFSVLAWRIPGMAEPGRLPSMGSHTVGHDWSDLAAAAPRLICGAELLYQLWTAFLHNATWESSQLLPCTPLLI